MIRKKFYIDEIPDSHEVARWMRANTDWVKLMDEIKPRRQYPPVLAFRMDKFNAGLLTSSILDATTMYGDHGWKSTSGPSKEYSGFSLVYNPEHQEQLDPHSSTLGTVKNAPGTFFYGSTEQHETLKNSYFDGYGFRVPTPASSHGEIGAFMERCKRTRIRSRCSIINGHMHNGTGWHRDEPIFVNTRINIPILTNQPYVFQLEDHQPVHLDLGWAYSWDTHKPHQVFSTEETDTRRIHLVLGFSPWWDYLPEERAWIQNEFYGEKHPFDMLVDGDIFDGLEFDNNKTVI